MKRQRPQKKFTPRKRRNVSLYAPRAPATYTRRAIVRVPEYKVTDTVVNYLACTDSTGTALYSALANLTRGTGVKDNFEGGKIFPVGLQIKGRFYYDITNTQTAITCRLVIFQWYDNSTPTLATGAQQIFETVTNNGALVHSPISITNRSNIRVLMDKTYVLKTLYTPGANVSDIINFKKYIKGNRMSEVDFASGSATPQKGDIYICATYDPGALSDGTNPPAFQASTRLTFLD
jgi:hypothetical protein